MQIMSATPAEAHAAGRRARPIQFLEARRGDAVNVDGGITEWYRSGLPATLGGAA